MTNDFPGPFARQYETHLKHLKLKGLQPDAPQPDTPPTAAPSETPPSEPQGEAKTPNTTDAQP